MNRVKFKVIIAESRRQIHVEAPLGLGVGELVNRIVKQYHLPSIDARLHLRYSYVLSYDGTALNDQTTIGDVKRLAEDGETVLQLHTKAAGLNEDQGGLARFSLDGSWSVEGLETLLRELRQAYEALHASNVVLLRNRSREPFRGSLQGMHDSVLQNLRADERLLVRRISINSPGWIEVIGRLNPLETIRQYLKDRQDAKLATAEAERQRTKDESYQNAIEQAKAILEVESIKSRVAAERARVLLDVGFSLEEARPYVAEIIERPLEKLQIRSTAGQIACESVIELDISDVIFAEDAEFSFALPPGDPDLD